MKLRRLSPFTDGAPGWLGAFSFSLALCLSFGSCQKKDQGADWSGQKKATPPVAAQVAQAPAPAPAPTAPAVPAAAVAQGNGSIRFVAYNVENWLTMERSEDGKRIAAPKP